MSKRSFLCIATFWRITQITGELDYTPDERTVKEVKDVFKTFCLNLGNACVCGSGKMWSPADHCVIRKRVCCIYLHLTLPPCLAVEPLWLGISTCSHSSYLLAFLPLLQFSMSSINIASSLCPSWILLRFIGRAWDLDIVYWEQSEVKEMGNFICVGIFPNLNILWS